MRVEVQLGVAPDETGRRDAVHVAVSPEVAGDELPPGARVRRTDGDGGRWVVAQAGEKWVGVVDPFLDHVIRPGERFWLCLPPGTIVSLRHLWSHPDFPAKLPVKRASDEG